MGDGLYGFLNFAKDREGSSDLALVATPLAVPSGVHLSTTWEALCVWFCAWNIFLGDWVARFWSPITKIERWIPGLSVFMKDHEGSWILAFVATPLVVHPGCVSQLHMFLVYGLRIKPSAKVAIAFLLPS